MPTSKPDFAIATAVARPMPESEPVTIAVMGEKPLMPSMMPTSVTLLE
jgi:hypothetical protein